MIQKLQLNKHMERGLFNRTIRALHQMISQETTLKQNTLLIKKGVALGMPLSQEYGRKHILFVVAQTIITLIDQIIIEEKKEGEKVSRQEGCKNEEIGLKNDGKSTLSNTPKCLLGNLNIAVLIYEMFCPKINVWNIVQKMGSVKKALEREDGIFEVVHLKDKIFQIENWAQEGYKCYCQLFQSSFKSQGPELEIANCLSCLCQFHPSCQSSPIFCNRCLLKYCLMDLTAQLKDPFNINKQQDICFFGYLHTQIPPYSEQPQTIRFHIVRFNLPHFEQQADRKQKYIQIRLAVVDKLFPDELVLPTRMGLRPKTETNFFWDFNGVEFYFYLNYNQVRFSVALTKNCIIIKVPHRILETHNNVLIIKTVRRSQDLRIRSSQILQYWLGGQTEKVVMVGVISINNKNKNKNPTNTSAIPTVTLYQSCRYMQYIEKKINQVPYQIVSLYNQGGAQKIQVPVRSFGCQHIQCFDLQEFKQMNQLQKIPSRKYKKKKVKPLPQPQEWIQIDSDDSEGVVEILEDVEDVMQTVNDQFMSQNKVQPMSKKIFKTQSMDLPRRKKPRVQKQQRQPICCPVCQRRLLILYQDPLFKRILQNSGFYKRVKIFSDGEYTFELSKPLSEPIQLINDLDD